MKDIEWLKERVEDHIEPYEEEDYLSYITGCTDVAEIILGLIDQLDEPEVLSQEWIENHTASAYTIAHYSEEDVRVIMVSDLQNLLVPKQELPVIPKFVADLMEDYNDASIQSFLSDAFRNYREGRAERADTWITKKPADFVDAYRYGYTVKEKKYYILLPKIKRNWLYVSLRSNYDEFIDHYTDSIEDLQVFTEKEIKAIEPRYFAFAVPVEELEE